MMRTLTVLATVGLLVAPALADWDVGDPYKMHYPQLPDPTGWDINITRDFMFDDWMCTSSGPVTDIHFWGSWRGDIVGQFARIIVSIRADVPVGADPNYTFSHPQGPAGTGLWMREFYPQDWTMRGPYSGVQGWYDPQPPTTMVIGDHTQFFQINIENILDPFYQEEGTVYWLGIHAIPVSVGPEFGWKTSQDHWNDDAAFYYGGWNELIDPLTGESLDLAFVITPEPAALAVLGLGLVALRRR